MKGLLLVVLGLCMSAVTAGKPATDVPNPLPPACVAELEAECGQFLINGTKAAYYPCISCLQNRTVIKALFAAGCPHTSGSFNHQCKGCAEYCPPNPGPNNPPICVPNPNGTPKNCVGPCGTHGEPWAPSAVCDRICDGVEYKCCEEHNNWWQQSEDGRYCKLQQTE